MQICRDQIGFRTQYWYSLSKLKDTRLTVPANIFFTLHRVDVEEDPKKYGDNSMNTAETDSEASYVASAAFKILGHG